MVKVEIEDEQGISLHVDTIRKRVHELGRVARKKSFVNKIIRGKRAKFSKEMLERPVEFWKNLVWSDESKFNLFSSDDKMMIWRTSREEFDPKCTILTVKHGDGSVMIWEFHTSGSWKTVCHERILLLRYFGTKSATINQLFETRSMMHFHARDDDPQHTSGLTKDWLKRKRI